MKRYLNLHFCLLILLAALFILPGNPKQIYANKLEQAYINVSAATLWSEPNLPRPIDKPSTTNPVDLWKWTKSMTLDEKLWLVGKLETQALYGNKVTILEKMDNWVKVIVHGQPTPRDSRGYIGWMPVNQLTHNIVFKSNETKPFVLVSEPTTYLYKNATLKTKDIEISFNTRLPVLKEIRNAFGVLTPNGQIRWLEKKAGKVYVSEKAIPKPSQQDLIATGKKFLKLPYLWSGMSGFGFDCSGFTFTLHQAHGITIPRDAGPQSRGGKPVDLKNLKPGDLLFFAHEKGKGSVHHVAMYIGNDKMIHSPNSARSIEIISIHTPQYKEELASARRYL